MIEWCIPTSFGCVASNSFSRAISGRAHCRTAFRTNACAAIAASSSTPSLPAPCTAETAPSDDGDDGDERADGGGSGMR
jgi:hypothetical protein